MTLGARPTTGSTSTPKRFSKCFSMADRNSALVVIDTTTLASFLASSSVFSHSPGPESCELSAIEFNDHAIEQNRRNRIKNLLLILLMKSVSFFTARRTEKPAFPLEQRLC